MNNSHLACQTNFTRTGELSMYNGKPYRTPMQKIEAKHRAKKVNGTFKSPAPVTYHPVPNKKGVN